MATNNPTTLIDALFEQFCNGLDQERAWAAREEGEYGKMFETHINEMSNMELLRELDRLP
jgi:hypothetical protein